MEDQTLIAWLALGISALGFVTSIWSAWVSHRSYSHSRLAHEEEKRLAFEKERSELLEIINSSRKILDKTRIEIGTLKAQFEAEPQEIQALMVNYTNLFTEYLPKVEGGVRQATALWDEVAEWSPETSIYAMVMHQARFRALIHDDQTAHESALYCIGVFKEKLELAKKVVNERQPV
jgi:hypothetical protein